MRFRNLAIGLAALAAAATVALYGIDREEGNVAQAACAGALDTAERMRPLATGEVAAFQVARQAKDLGGLGFLAPDGAATTLAREADGKVRLVNLWATWCAPCRKEMPALDRLEAEKGGEDFAVVPVSIDLGGPEKPAAFLESIEVVRLPLYRDPTTDIFNDLKREGLAVGLPVTALVDRQGCLLGHMNGPAEWDSDDAVRLIEAALAPASA